MPEKAPFQGCSGIIYLYSENLSYNTFSTQDRGTYPILESNICEHILFYN